MKSQRTDYYYDVLEKNGFAINKPKKKERICDPTFGSNTLIGVGENYINQLSPGDRSHYLCMIEDFKNAINK